VEENEVEYGIQIINPKISNPKLLKKIKNKKVSLNNNE
jgi:hypothetical protein